MKLTTKAPALLAALVGAVVASGCQGATPDAAVVNGTHINQSDLVRELRAIGANKRFVTAYDQAVSSGQGNGVTILATDTAAPTFTQGFTAVVLNTDVQAAVIHAEVVRRQVEPTPAEITAAKPAAAQQFGQDPSLFEAFSAWFQHLYEVRTAEQQALQRALPPVDTTPAGVDRFYRDNPQDFVASECVSHILVPDEAEAAALRARIEAGASFASIARQSSTDKASAAQGGSLGCNPPGQYVQSFEQVADSIPVGELSPPVYDSQFNGWHLILVTSRQLTPLNAQLRSQILQHLQSESPITVFLQSAQKTLRVHINPAYGSWDPQQGVVPPQPPGPNSGLPTTTTTTASGP